MVKKLFSLILLLLISLTLFSVSVQGLDEQVNCFKINNLPSCGFAICQDTGGFMNVDCSCDFSHKEYSICSWQPSCPDWAPLTSKNFEVNTTKEYDLLILENEYASYYDVLLKDFYEHEFESLGIVNVSDILFDKHGWLKDSRLVFFYKNQSGFFVYFVVFHERDFSYVSFFIDPLNKELKEVNVEKNVRFVENEIVKRAILRDKEINPLEGFVFERVIPYSTSNRSFLLYRHEDDIQQKRVVKSSFNISKGDLNLTDSISISRTFEIVDYSFLFREELLSYMNELVPVEDESLIDIVKALKNERFGSHVSVSIVFEQGFVSDNYKVLLESKVSDLNDIKLSFNGEKNTVLFNTDEFSYYPNIFVFNNHVIIINNLSVFDSEELAIKTINNKEFYKRAVLDSFFDESSLVFQEINEEFFETYLLIYDFLINPTNVLNHGHYFIVLEEDKLVISKDYDSFLVEEQDDVQIGFFSEDLQVEVSMNPSNPLVDDDALPRDVGGGGRIPSGSSVDLLLWFSNNKVPGVISDYSDLSFCEKIGWDNVDLSSLNVFLRSKSGFSSEFPEIIEIPSGSLSFNEATCSLSVQLPVKGVKVGAWNSRSDALYELFFEVLVNVDDSIYLVLGSDELRFHSVYGSVPVEPNIFVPSESLEGKVLYELPDLFRGTNIKSNYFRYGSFSFSNKITRNSCFLPEGIDNCRLAGGDWYSVDSFEYLSSLGIRGLRKVSFSPSELDNVFIDAGLGCFRSSAREDNCGSSNQQMCAFGCDMGLSPCGVHGICQDKCLKDKDYSIWKPIPGDEHARWSVDGKPIGEADASSVEGKSADKLSESASKILMIDDIRVTLCKSDDSRWNNRDVCDPKTISKEDLQSKNYDVYVKVSGVNCDKYGLWIGWFNKQDSSFGSILDWSKSGSCSDNVLIYSSNDLSFVNRLKEGTYGLQVGVWTEWETKSDRYRNWWQGSGSIIVEGTSSGASGDSSDESGDSPSSSSGSSSSGSSGASGSSASFDSDLCPEKSFLLKSPNNGKDYCWWFSFNNNHGQMSWSEAIRHCRDNLEGFFPATDLIDYAYKSTKDTDKELSYNHNVLGNNGVYNPGLGTSSSVSSSYLLVPEHFACLLEPGKHLVVKPDPFSACEPGTIDLSVPVFPILAGEPQKYVVYCFDSDLGQRMTYDSALNHCKSKGEGWRVASSDAFEALLSNDIKKQSFWFGSSGFCEELESMGFINCQRGKDLNNFYWSSTSHVRFFVRLYNLDYKRWFDVRTGLPSGELSQEYASRQQYVLCFKDTGAILG